MVPYSLSTGKELGLGTWLLLTWRTICKLFNFQSQKICPRSHGAGWYCIWSTANMKSCRSSALLWLPRVVNHDTRWMSLVWMSNGKMQHDDLRSWATWPNSPILWTILSQSCSSSFKNLLIRSFLCSSILMFKNWAVFTLCGDYKWLPLAQRDAKC